LSYGRVARERAIGEDTGRRGRPQTLDLAGIVT